MNRKPEKNPAARAYSRAFYRGNRLRCAAAMLLLLLSVPQNLIGSWLLGEVVDVITSGDVEWLKRTLLFTVVFVAAIFCVNTAMYRVKSTFIHKALAQYKSLAFQNLSEKSISAFSRTASSRPISSEAPRGSTLRQIVAAARTGLYQNIIPSAPKKSSTK